MANPIIINDSSCEIIYLKKKDKRLAKIINTVGPIVCSTHDGNEYAFFVHEIIEQMLSIKAGKKRLLKFLLRLLLQSVCRYRSYHQGERRVAAALYLFRRVYLKETGLRIYCNGA